MKQIATQCRKQKKIIKINCEIIQITTFRIILSIAYTKTLEILFEAYLYLYNNKINARVLIGQSSTKNSPAARDLQILLVIYQHPAWFISL